MLKYSRSFFESAHHILRTSTTKKLWSLRKEVQEMQQEINRMKKDSCPVGLKRIPRTPSETALNITIPLEKDLEVRNEYINPVGDLRFGKLLEDLDAFACTSNSMY